MGGDSTLVLGNGDKNGAPYVNGYRFVNNSDSNTYLIISCWDNNLGDNVPVLLFYFPTDSPSTNSDTITYHVLTSAEVMDMYQELSGTFNEASDDEVVSAINYLALDWFKIFTRYNNLDDIDSLIEKLEREMPTITSNNPRINQALEQRRQKIEELKEKSTELEKTNNELENYFFLASHDLQEPNRTIISFLTNLEKKYKNSIDEKGHKYIKYAIDGAYYMRKSILNLQEHTKIGKNLNFKNIDLNLVIKT